MTTVDRYTYAYFAKVIPLLWDTLQDRGVDTFYILDNAIRKDRFTLYESLFSLTGAAVISPYTERGEIKDYSKVKRQITACIAKTRNIIYIEKDDEANYLDKVSSIATATDYFVIFRNQGPESTEVEILK
jgi:hypothetical protein